MMKYQRLANGKWTQVDGRTYHKHDVRAMTSYESEDFNVVVSGGVDRTFSVISLVDSKTENLRVLPPVPQDRVVSLAATSRLLLSWSDNEVKIWQIDDIKGADLEGIAKRYLIQMIFNVIATVTTLTIE